MARFIAETLAVSGQACIETEQADTKLLQDDDDVWTLQIARNLRNEDRRILIVTEL
jgi:hypothetical protein